MEGWAMKRHDLKAFREMKMYPLCPNWDTCSSFSVALRCCHLCDYHLYHASHTPGLTLTAQRL